MIQIAPSMLAADFLHLEKDVETVNKYADIFHLDVMDGVFVPNISFGFPVIEAIAKKALEKGIKAVVFDRGGYVYTGRIAALAEAARENGLKF